MMFQLSQEEVDTLSRSKFLTLNSGRGHNIKYRPLAFTEQGIYMLMTVLKGELATQQSIALVRLFKQMRHYFAENAGIIQRLDSLEQHKIETDIKFNRVFTLIDKYKIENKQGIFFQGQIYDAYSQFQKFIQQAQKDIILIDNYIDLTVLDRLRDKNVNVAVTIYTRPDTIVKPLAVKKFNNQYPTLTMKYTTTMHDRFLIIDNSEIYHIGASLKDLGKKCFEFTKLEDAKRMIQDILKAL